MDMVNHPNILNQGIKFFSSLTYLIDAENKKELSFNDVNLLSSKLAYQFDHIYNIKKEDKIFVLLPNSIEFVVVFHALLKLKAIPIPLSPELTNHELQEYTTYFEPDNILIGDSIKVKKDTFNRVPVISIPDYIRIWMLDCQINEYFHFPDYKDGELGVVIFTSGTTNKPKGAMLKLNNLLIALKKSSELFQMGTETRMFQVMPFFHAEGCFSTVFVPLLTGSSVVFLDNLDIKKIMNYWNYVSEFKADYLILLPTLLQTLIATHRSNGITQTTARYAKCGSSFLPLKIRKEFEEMFHVKIIDVYGSTEANAVSIGEFTKEYDSSVGRLTHITEVRISGDKEILVANSGWFAGYLNNPVLTQEFFDGYWYKTGDIGEINDDKVYLTGRKDDLINRNGYKISPQEIDATVVKMDEYVNSSFTVGVKDEYMNDKIVTFIVLKQNGVSDLKSIKDTIFMRCRNLLSLQKIPDEIVFVDQIFKNSIGKPSKQLMSDVYRANNKDSNTI